MRQSKQQKQYLSVEITINEVFIYIQTLLQSHLGFYSRLKICCVAMRVPAGKASQYGISKAITVNEKRSECDKQNTNGTPLLGLVFADFQSRKWNIN